MIAKFNKRFLSLALSLLLVFSCLPIGSLAAQTIVNGGEDYDLGVIEIGQQFDIDFDGLGSEYYANYQKETGTSTEYPEPIWATSNAAVCTVDDKGLITAVGSGSAVITATFPYSEPANKVVTITATVAKAPTGVTITPKSYVLELDYSVQLMATITPDDATDKSITWVSSDEDVATVEDGYVIAVGTGTAIITAQTVNGLSDSATITVVEGIVEASSVTVSPQTSEILVGKDVILTATVLPEDAADKSITWQSSSPEVATVDATGKVTGLKGGTVTITATAGNGVSGNATVTVSEPVVTPTSTTTPKPTTTTTTTPKPTTTTTTTPKPTTTTTTPVVTPTSTTTPKPTTTTTTTPKPTTTTTTTPVVTPTSTTTPKPTTTTTPVVTPTSTTTPLVTPTSTTPAPVDPVVVEVTPEFANMKTGQTLQLTANVYNTNDKRVIWQSADESIATVDANGVVTALKEGTVGIIATSVADSKASDSAAITITNAIIDPTGITVSPKEATVNVGESVQLTATVTPNNATDKTVTWVTSDASIATVDRTGKVTGIKEGTVTITATTVNGLSDSATVTVVSPVVTPTSTTTPKPTTTTTTTPVVTPTSTTTPKPTTTTTTTPVVTPTSTTTPKPTTTTTTTPKPTTTTTTTPLVTPTSTTPAPVDPVVVEVTPEFANMKTGQTLQLTATVYNTQDKRVIWQSTDESIATVDANGIVTALKEGTVGIIATSVADSKASDSAAITITNAIIDPTGITVSPKEATVNVGESVQLTATVTPDNATDKTVTWVTSDASIATVDKTGKVTGIKEGTVTITATTVNGLSDSATVTVVSPVVTPTSTTTPKPTTTTTTTPKPTTTTTTTPLVTPTSTTTPAPQDPVVVEVTPEVANMKTGETLQLTATVKNTEDKRVTWVSSDETIATVDANGVVTALKEGTVEITATSVADSKASDSATVNIVKNIIEATGITVSPKDSTIKVGQNVQLTAVVTPEDATDKTVTWNTSDATIATVDQTGKVTGIKPGTVTITATTSNGISDTATVTVELDPAGITVAPKDSTIKVNGTVQLTATVTPDNATNKAVTWKSSDESVATVDANGKVTGVNHGTVTITATTWNGFSDTATVKVELDPTGIIVTPKDSTIKAGESVQLTATVTPVNATDKTVTWKSSDESIATVDAIGKVTGIKPGTVTITASTVNGISDTATVTVELDPAGIEVSPKNSTIQVNGVVQLTATVTPNNATNKAVTWVSSNTAVATVDANGKVTGITTGTVTITATTWNGLSDTATVTVELEPTGIIVSPKNNVIEVGDKAQLTAKVSPDNATDKTVTWKSSNTEIATVDQNGLVTGLVVGEVTITATTVNGISDTATVTVKQSVIMPESIEVLPETAQIEVGKTVTLTATVLPENAENKNVTWRSSNENIAIVDQNGVVRGVSKGTAIITASTVNGLTDTSTITVIEPSEIVPQSITVSPKTGSVVVGNTITLTAKVLPEEAANKTVTWQSSNNAIAVVDQNGVVRGVSVGTVTITASTWNGLSDTATVSVTPIVPTNIVVSPKESTIEINGATILTATVTPELAEDKTVIWETSNSRIATVNQSGVVVGITEGTVTITATTVNGLKDTATVHVIPIQPASIDVIPETAIIKIGNTTQLIAEIRPANAADKSITWTSADNSIATVDGNGLVTAVSEGVVKITATTANGLSDYSTITVTKDAVIIEPTGIIVTPKESTVIIGATVPLTATVIPDNADDKTVRWVSSNNAIAVVDPNGVVRGVSEGTVTITAYTVNGYNDTAIVHVKAEKPVVPTGIVVSPKKSEIDVNNTVKLTATVTPDNAVDKTVTWVSSNPSIATVDKNGLVTGRADGTVTITATTVNGLSDTATVTVIGKFDPEIIRIGGHDRVDTANLISENGWSDGADTVMITNAMTFADALAAGPLGYMLDAPILLTMNRGTEIDADVLAQIKALGAQNVYIIGGPLAVNEDIEASLAKLGYNVKRIRGRDRYGTAVSIAKEMDRLRGGTASSIFIANGMNYPDALSIGPVAALKNVPILFTNPASTSTKLNATTLEYLNGIEFTDATILGGSLAISDNIIKDLKAAGAKNVDRVSGQSRYLTSLAIYTTYIDVFTSHDMAFATGSAFPDALAGGVFAAKKGIPVFLVDPGRSTEEIKDIIKAGKAKKIYVFGGQKAVSDETVESYLEREI